MPYFYDRFHRCLETDLIHRVVLDDDWNSISETFVSHPELRTKPITLRLETPLMIAVGTNQSHDFVKELLSSLSTDNLINWELEAENDEGDTALHYAVKFGNMTDATLLLNEYSSNPLHKNKNGSTPLSYASRLGNKKMFGLLISKIDILNRDTPADQSSLQGYILSLAINAEFLDIALKLVEGDITPTTTWNMQRSLNILTTKPHLFLSGSSLGFWGSRIYSLLHVDESRKTTTQKYAHDEGTCKRTSPTLWFKKILQYLASPIKNIYDMKVRHRQAKQLVERICQIVVDRHNNNVVDTIFRSTMATAITYGNIEVIKECTNLYKKIIWANSEESKIYLFHESIKQRREQIYNIFYQSTSYKKFIASHADENKENALHIVAKLAPFHRLNTIAAGPALQMQRELQWFEEIKTLVGPLQIEAQNKDGKTPGEVFTDAHENLLKEGRQWMKDTATTCSFVAALVVTLAFAAAFTLPGGEKSEGKIAFIYFIITDAIALFLSVTTMLMFLGILTSRYAEEDFLYTLPNRMGIGFMYLILSLGAMMVTFSATLVLVLPDKVPRIAAPLLVIASISMALCYVLQFRLLKELTYSAYGPSIFRKQEE